MHFHISRNGQMYGPYTLEDLKRYLATGNVLPTDLAKSDGMAEWVPVMQILATYGGQAAGATAGAAPPFGAPVYGAPPAAALASSTYPDPPNLSWWLVALIALFTGGLFMDIWNIVLAAWVRRVQPNATSLFYYIAVLVLRILSAGLSLQTLLHQHPWTGSPNFAYGGTHLFGRGLVIGVIFWVVKLIARFSQKASLEEHFNSGEPIGLRLNAAMVFFFGGLYFQSELSRIVEMKRAARMMAGGVPQY